jgi:hypothetical protein
MYGPWSTKHDTTVLITGGSGKYLGAGGEAVLSNLVGTPASYKYTGKWCT